LRTPLPLLAVIAIAAGVGIAYVNQTARVTQATYQVSALATEQQQLSTENSKLGDDLSRLQASERIVAAAQQLGMKPAGSWSYVAASPVAVLVTPSPSANSKAQPSDPMQRLVASIGNAFGVSGGRP
jgi:cell division protein FtsL